MNVYDNTVLIIDNGTYLLLLLGCWLEGGKITTELIDHLSVKKILRRRRPRSILYDNKGA